MGIEAVVLVGAIGFLILGCSMSFGAETDAEPVQTRRRPFTVVRIRQLDESGEESGEERWRVGWN
ncbi:MAG: hypothetical protein ABSD03_13045 [Vulcanimicrobiaceae bacterium]|jgi:hypothetical protein